MKKSKKIFSVIIAFLFVGSLGYFASLTPTGAWLFDEQVVQKKFDFGNFDITKSGSFTAEQSLTFDAATKICDNQCIDDFNSAYEFGDDEGKGDRIVYKKDIEVTNAGNISARLYVKVEPGVESGTARSNAGMKYFFFFVGNNNDGSEKSNSVAINEGLKGNLTLDALKSYDEGYLTIAPETQSVLRILIWCDYDVLGDTDFTNNMQNVAEFTTDAKIMLTAIQDSEGVTAPI